MLFKKYSLDKIDYYLVSLFTLLSIASFNSLGKNSFWFLRRQWFYETHGSFSLIEFIQSILLILNIFLILKNRKFLVKYANNLMAYFVRLSIPIFLIYEETSYYFKDFFKESFLSQKNLQGEANFHNLSFMEIRLFEDNQYIGDFLPNGIPLKIIIYFSISIILSFGAFLPFLKRFSFIFFEKRFLLYGLIFIFNIIFPYIIRNVFGIMNTNSSYYFLNDEFLELFYYQLLLIDLRKKIIKSKI